MQSFASLFNHAMLVVRSLSVCLVIDEEVFVLKKGLYCEIKGRTHLTDVCQVADACSQIADSTVAQIVRLIAIYARD
ncbi:hypothetical protein O988_06950 [Pseudogymnoascus sp. VKM F-3808]|nr:hypothetical protein O988_06950 [Pseudogymnoascus sp. VKM F-3808]